MTPVAIAFGANLGDRLENITQGLKQLAATVDWKGCSAVYETEPMYKLDQPMYLNGVAYGLTDCGPIALVHHLKKIEAGFGPRSTERNGPRSLDLDLVIYGSAWLDLKGTYAVQVPHPRLGERRFVLDPLAEAWPDLILPWVDIEALRHSSPVKRQYMIRRADAPLRF